MTDTAVPAVAELPAKKPGFIRWWGFGLVLLVLVVTFVALPLLANQWVRARVTQALAGQGWELAPETELSVSVFGATLAATNVKVRQIGNPTDMFTMTRLNAEMAVTDSIRFGDVIVHELAAEGMHGSLRRGPDGRIPGEDPNASTTGTDKPSGTSGMPGSQLDWKTYYEKAMERFKKWAEERKAKQSEPGQPGQPSPDSAPMVQESEPDFEWPAAKRYKPTPHPDRRMPRVVIRSLKASGTGFALPDATPFDVGTFALDGTNVCSRQDVGETMTLKGTATTAGAGDATLDLIRKADDTGSLDLRVPAVPLTALNHPALAGDSFAAYGATGTASVVYASTWTGWDLTAGLNSTISGLNLAPTAAAGGDAQKAAQVINALKGRPVLWPVQVGGQLYAPTITDTGLDELMKNALSVDAVKEAAKDAALQKGTEELNKQAEKDPRVKDGMNKLKGLLGK